MARLNHLAPALATLRPRIARQSDESGHSRAAEPWRKWYSLKRWRDLRLATFVRDRFTCRMCGRMNGNTRELTADHVKPHRGDVRLFWDPDNVQTLCTDPCHNKHKQAQERAPSW